MMLEQGNQQVTNIGSWVCGILEGEGCFSEHKNIVVLIHNTDKGIIEVCEQYLKDNYIYYEIIKKTRPNRKLLYIIVIQLLKNDVINFPYKFYELMQPYLECRRDQFEQILGTSTTTCLPSVDKSWLTGIWEAEGSLSLTIRYRNDRSGPRNNCVATIENTNKKIIDKIILNLRSIKCPYYINHKTPQDLDRKDSWRIEISGMLRCRKFLYEMENYWISPRNKKRSSLMSEFIESRLRLPQNATYTDRQFQIIQSMTDLNR